MLRLTLATVLAQDMSDFEVLVIGDGCTDASEAAVASFADARLRWHNLRVNSGAPSIPNNTGLSMARGRYIAHLGHDDFWLPWHLSGLLESIAATGADWAYPLVVAIGPDGIRHCSGPPRPGVPDAEHHVPPSGWLYRREIADTVGEWADPASLPWQVDFDVMRRAAVAGARFTFHARPTALKFPSSLFPEGYRTGEPAPIQLDYFARLQAAPHELEQNILRELATRFAQLDRGGGKGIFNRQHTERSLQVEGGDEGSVESQREQFQERRLGRLHLRGLAPGLIPSDSPPGDAAAQPSPSSTQERFAVREARRERRRQRNAPHQKRRARDAPPDPPSTA